MFCSFSSDAWAAMGGMLSGIGQFGLVVLAIIGVSSWRESLKLNEQQDLVRRMSIIFAQIEAQMLLPGLESGDPTHEQVDNYFNQYRTIYEKLTQIELESWILGIHINMQLHAYKTVVTKYFLQQIKIFQLTCQKAEIPMELNSCCLKLSDDVEQLKQEISFQLRVELWTLTGKSYFHRIFYNMILKINDKKR